jgi:hypothetical protein
MEIDLGYSRVGAIHVWECGGQVCGLSVVHWKQAWIWTISREYSHADQIQALRIWRDPSIREIPERVWYAAGTITLPGAK